MFRRRGNEVERQKVILDVDTGADDAVALLMAASAPELELVGVTVVHGNGPLELTVSNTLKTLQAAGFGHVPVFAGAARPLLRSPVPTAPVQRRAFDLPQPSIEPQPGHAVDFLVEYFMAGGEDTILVPLAPLTNVALALSREPGLARRIPRMVMMGGAVGAGNVTPAAEFNIYADPEAARAVFLAGIPIVMVGLEATASAPVGLADVERFRALGTPAARIAADLMALEVAWFRDVLEQEAQIFDACAVAGVIEPEILGIERMHVDVETGDELTLGRTVCEGNHQSPNVDVAVKVDRPRFLEIVRRCLG
jgi:inosine-uridine nucleoside N-ribohydrolase